MIFRTLPLLASFLIADFVLFRLIPGVDTGAQRTLRYAPVLGLSAVLFVVGLVLTLWPMRLGAASPTSSLPRFSARLLFFTASGSVFFAFLVGKALVFRLDHESVWKDTQSYAAVAEQSLQTSEFWAGERSFTLPLIYRLLGVNRVTLTLEPLKRAISGFQLLLAVASWTALAVITASALKNRWLGPFTFGAILGLGLSLDVSLWDRILLTESVATSLFVLMLALCLFGLLRVGNLRWRRSGGRYVYLLGLGAIIILYSFARDTNAFFLAFCAVLMLAGLLLKSVRRRVALRPYVLVASLLLALFVVQNYTSNQGKRWEFPFFNVLHMRIGPDPAAREFFAARGMPADEATIDLLTKPRRGFFAALETSQEAQHLVQWVERAGKVTYYRYLLSRPAASLMAPIDRARNLISPLSTEYRADDYSIPIWLGLFSQVFFPLPLAIVLPWLGVLIVAAIILGRIEGLGPEWAIPALLLITVYPMMFIVWHGDAIEVERHAFQISLQVRLAGWMMTAFLADAWLRRLGTRSALAPPSTLSERPE